MEKQLSEGGVSAHELEKAKKRLEGEMEELRMSLEVCATVCIMIFFKPILQCCMFHRKLKVNWKLKKDVLLNFNLNCPSLNKSPNEEWVKKMTKWILSGEIE